MQTYDECISSYGESLDVLAGPRPARPENARTFVHAVLLDGRLVGHWRHPRGRASSNVEVSLYETPKPAVRNALDRAVERYANFLGDDLTWTTTR